MRLGEAWRVALNALRANRLRSVLTMLGVIIGVAAVVILVAIGTGAKQEVEDQVEGLGSNLLLVVPGEITFGSSPTSSRLTLDDVDAVGRIVGDPQRVAATVTVGETLRAGEQQIFATVHGVTETVPKVFVRPVARGEFLSRSDVDTRRRVAVLGSSAADQLFAGQDAVGRQVTIAGVRFRVIGVFAKTGSGALAGVDRDAEVHIPITAAQRLLGTNRVDGIAVKAPDRDTIGQLGDRIVAELEKRYPGETFSAVTQEQILGVVGRHPRPAHAGAGRDRRDLSAGRRGRRLQHHAGQRAGADPGDRPAQGRRRPAAGHPGAVPARGGAADHDRRADRDRHRGRCGRRGRPVHPAAGRDHLVVDRAGVRRLGGGRHRSSAWYRPGARDGWTRWSRCAPNDRGDRTRHSSTATLHSARACPSSPEGKPAPRHVPRSGEPCRRRNRPIHPWPRSSS